MDNTTTIALLIGALMPIIISLIKQANLNRWWNLVIALVSCGVAGFVTVWVRGELQAGNLLATIAIVFTAAQAAYASFWRDSTVETKLSSLFNISK